MPETFTALAVNRGDFPTLLPSAVELRVSRWSSEQEKTRYARTLLERGPRALVEALECEEAVGVLSSAYTLPSELRFAWQEPLPDGGRRIVLIAARPIPIWQDAMSTRGLEDTFTVLELRIDAAGEGEGKAAIGFGVGVDRSLELIEIADWDLTPVRLTAVRSLVPTT